MEQQEKKQRPIVCTRCDCYYFGYKDEDKEKICPRCKEALKKISDKTGKVTRKHINKTGNGRL